jgi:hypothetical protein
VWRKNIFLRELLNARLQSTWGITGSREKYYRYIYGLIQSNKKG